LKAYKVKVRTEPRRLLAVLKFKTYLVYISIKNIMIKTPFIKLYELKNPLTLEKVLKLIKIRLLNDIVVIEDSTGEKISLNLPEIDDISSLEFITFEIPRSSKPLKLLVSGPSKPLEIENRSLESMFKSFEELIKSIDFLDPDEI